MKHAFLKRATSLGAATALAGAGLAGMVGLGATAAGAATVTTNFVFGTPLLGGWTQQQVPTDAVAPSTVTQGSTFTLAITPAPTAIPTSEGGGLAAVNYLNDITTIVPVPAGATYVSTSTSGSGSWTGGPSSSPSGSFPLTVTYCTATNGTTCTATPQNLTASSSTSTAPFPFAGSTTPPYIEVSSGSTQLPAGATVTFPTITTTLKATGAVGTSLVAEISEFDTTANITVLGNSASESVHGWPDGSTALPSSATSSSSPIPPANPVPLATTTITAASTVPGAPTIGTATANANGSVTVTWTAPASDGGSAITGYTVNVTGPGGPFTGTSAGASAASATVGGLTPGTKYSFTVSATNAIGTGTASGSVSATTAAGTPTPIGTIGGIGLALVIGAGLVVYQRRRLGARAGA